MGGGPRQLEWGFLPVQLGIVYSENLTDVDSILPSIPTQEIILKSGSVHIIGQKMFAIASKLMLGVCSSSTRRWAGWAVMQLSMTTTGS